MPEVLKRDVLSLFGGDLHDKSRLLYPTGSNKSVESRVVSRFRSLRSRGGLRLSMAHLTYPITIMNGTYGIANSSVCLRRSKQSTAITSHSKTWQHGYHQTLRS